jgi:hypothetical protein
MSTARGHHAAQRRGDCVAGRGERAAAWFARYPLSGHEVIGWDGEPHWCLTPRLESARIHERARTKHYI